MKQQCLRCSASSLQERPYEHLIIAHSPQSDFGEEPSISLRSTHHLKCCVCTLYEIGRASCRGLEFRRVLFRSTELSLLIFFFIVSYLRRFMYETAMLAVLCFQS